MSRFSKWLEKKAHSVRIRRIFRKYGPSPELGHNPYDLSEEQQRKAFLEAYVETGDTRCLIDYFQLRRPQDYRYFEKAFREALMMSVFRRYDEVRYMLVEFWHDILVLEKQNERQELLLKKYFGKK